MGGSLNMAAVSLYNEDHAAYRESVQTFLARRVVPEYAVWGKAKRIPAELFIQAAEDGFLSMTVPEEAGGLGIDDPRFGAVVLAAAMEAGVPALALAFGVHNDVVIPVISAYAGEAEQATWLPRLASGECVGTVVEGDCEIAHGDSGALVSGTASFVPSAAFAGLFLVRAGGGVVLIDPTADGVTVTPSESGIGLKPAGFGDISFDSAVGVALHADAADAVRALVDLGSALSAAAGAREALKLGTDYALDRKVFDVPLASLENTREVIAAMSSATDAAAIVAESALAIHVDGKLDPARAAATARHCIDCYLKVVDHGVQLHGGYGYILEYPIARAYADAWFWTVQGGVADTRRESIAAVLLG